MEIINTTLKSDDFYSYYTSAPTSPSRRYNLNGFIFLSMPTSPSRDLSGSNYGSPMGDFLNLVENFEFEGSKRFNPYDNGLEKSKEASMVYADELFLDGKMLPLRSPPGAHYARHERKSGNCSTASSPGARSSMIKVPFLRQRSLWNDGYDPFTNALNKVREECNVVRKSLDKGQLRRAKSLSPLRVAHGSPRWPTTNKHNKLGPSPKEHGPTNLDVFGPKVNMIRCDSTESRKQRIKNFLLKNASFGKSEKKEQRVPLLLKKLHYSVRFRSLTPKTVVKISREIKSLMKHRAKFLFCLAKGLGTKSSKKLS